MAETLKPINMKLIKPGRLKELPLTRTKFAVVPLKALDDPNLSDGAARTLARICGFANRAGLAWVSQDRLATDIGKRREVINRHFRALKKHGYLQPISKAYKGFKGATMRVVFDPTISTRTAVARAGNGQEDEDVLPPEEQKRLIAQMLKGVIKPVNQSQDTRRYNMPADGETVTTRRIKAGLKKQSKPVNKPVDNLWITTQKEGKKPCQKSHTNYIKELGVCIEGVSNKELMTVLEESVDIELFMSLVDIVIARRREEGLPLPSLPNLAESVLLAQQQYLENALGLPTSDDQGSR